MFYGEFLGGVLGGAVYCRIRKKSFWQMADLACMGLLIGQIIGKWGSFFNRESFGEYADNIFSMAAAADCGTGRRGHHGYA